MGNNIKAVYTESFKAYTDLSDYQYHFVKLTSDRTVTVCSAITDVPVGILQNAPDAAGKPAEVMVIGRTPLVSGEALTIGALVNTGTDGHGLVCSPGVDTTTYIAAKVVEISGASGEYANVIVNCAAPCRAA